MERYIDADRLKAEIEKRMHICDGIFERDSDTYYQGKAVAYQETLSLIDSLQQEQSEVDLEKEIDSYFKKWWMDLTDQGYILRTPDGTAGLISVKNIARHFYILGLKNNIPVTQITLDELAKEGEKPSEDFEKEWDEFEDRTESYITSDYPTYYGPKQIARHFYSLGQQAKKDLPEWKKAYAGTHFGEDVVTISPKGKDFPRVVETALTDCLFIPISELMKLAKKED